MSFSTATKQISTNTQIRSEHKRNVLPPSTRLYQPPHVEAPATTSKLLPAPFHYLASPTPPPAPISEGYTSNVHTRIAAYMARRTNELKNAAVPSVSIVDASPTSLVDHRPPSESFDEYLPEYHEQFRSSPNGSRRQAFKIAQARAARARARAMGMLDEDEEECSSEDGIDAITHQQDDESKQSDLDSLTPSELLQRRRARRAARKEAARLAKQHADEQLERQLLSNFNTAMRVAEQADKIIGVQAVAALAAANSATNASGAQAPQLPMTFETAVAVTVQQKQQQLNSPAAHAPAAAAAAAQSTSSSLASSSGSGGSGSGSGGVGVGVFTLPLVAAGTPVFHFEPRSAAGLLPNSNSKTLTRAEERRREQIFEQEKKKLAAFLAGKDESILSPRIPAASPLVGRSTPSDPHLSRIIEEPLAATAASPSAARRVVGFARDANRSRTPSRPNTAPTQTPHTLSQTKTNHTHQANTNNRTTHTHTRASRKKAARQYKDKMLGTTAPGTRTLTLESKKVIEHQNKARQLFAQVCSGNFGSSSPLVAGGVADAASLVSPSSSSYIDTFGFGLDLTVDEVARNILQEQQRIGRGEGGGNNLYIQQQQHHQEEKETPTIGNENIHGFSNGKKSDLKFIQSHPTNTSDTGTDPGKADLASATASSTAVASSSNSPGRSVLGDGVDDGDDDDDDGGGVGVADDVSRKKEQSLKRIAAAAATGEYTVVSPELVNALLKATKRGDATMIATLIEQVPEEQRLEFVNMRDKNGSTPIFHTVWPGHLFALRTLLQAGADPNIQNVKKNTALHLAVERGHETLIRCLLEFKADYQLLNYENKLCYHTPQKDDDRTRLERFVLNCVAEVKRGKKSNFKLDIQALSLRPNQDPFNKSYYETHGWTAAEIRTWKAAEEVQSEELRKIMEFKPPLESKGIIQGNPLGSTRSSTLDGAAKLGSTGSVFSKTATLSSPGSPSFGSSQAVAAPVSPRPSSSPLKHPGPVFTKFMSRALGAPISGAWPLAKTQVIMKSGKMETRDMALERMLHQRWRKAQRKAAKLRRAKELEERRARMREKDPHGEWSDEYDPLSPVGSPSTTCHTTRSSTRAATRATMRSGDATPMPMSRRATDTIGSPWSGTSPRQSITITPVAHAPAYLMPQTTQETEHQTDVERNTADNNGDNDDDDDDDDLIASDDEFESLLPAASNQPAMNVGVAVSDSTSSSCAPHTRRSRPSSRRIDHNSTAATASFAFYAPGVTNSATAREMRLLPETPSIGVSVLLANRAASNETSFASYYRGISIPLDATIGTPIVEIGQSTYAQPMSIRMGMNDQAAYSSPSAMVDPTIDPSHQSMLAPPFPFSDDLGAHARSIPETLRPRHQFLSNRFHASDLRDFSAPPNGVTPSAFPRGYPFAASDRAKPPLSQLAGPTLVAQAEEMGVIHTSEQPRPGAPVLAKRKATKSTLTADSLDDGQPLKSANDSTPRRGSSTEEKTRSPSPSPVTVGTSEWHARRYEAMGTRPDASPRITTPAASHTNAHTPRTPTQSFNRATRPHLPQTPLQYATPAGGSLASHPIRVSPPAVSVHRTPNSSRRSSLAVIAARFKVATPAAGTRHTQPYQQPDAYETMQMLHPAHLRL